MSEKGARAWPIGIVVGLGLVGVANAIMISIALSHPSVPASEDHWAESLDWDRELEQRERSAALGWSVAELGPCPDRAGALGFRVRDREGRALSGLRGELRLERADSAAFDHRARLVELGEGRYCSAGELPKRGAYELELELSGPAGQRFVTREQVELDLLLADVGGPG